MYAKPAANSGPGSIDTSAVTISLLLVLRKATREVSVQARYPAETIQLPIATLFLRPATFVCIASSSLNGDDSLSSASSLLLVNRGHSCRLFDIVGEANNRRRGASDVVSVVAWCHWLTETPRANKAS